MGKRAALAVVTLLLTVATGSTVVGGGATLAGPPASSCAELACRMCRVLADGASRLTGDEPGYCVAGQFAPLAA